jgi:transposase
MARSATGFEVLEEAKRLLSRVHAAEELRQAQAVVLPLEFGFSMEQTAKAIGVSKGWTCQLRRRFILSGGKCTVLQSARGGRRHANMSHEEEVAFLAPFFEKAAYGGVLVVGEIKQALDERLGHVTALASTYNLLHRHGWRKLAPDKRHPKVDIKAQEKWKKNSQDSLRKSTSSGQGKRRSG